MLQPRCAHVAWRCTRVLPVHRLSLKTGRLGLCQSYSTTPSTNGDAPLVRRVGNNQGKRQKLSHASKAVEIPIAGQTHKFAGSFLRDLCKCEKCRDPSTRQKLQLTTNIDIDASAAAVDVEGETVSILWSRKSDDEDRHVTRLSIRELAHLAGLSSDGPMPVLPKRRLWLDEEFRAETKVIPFDAYMQDDRSLLKALRQLQTHGLVFLTQVPESAESVSQIAERIGPLKNTFYGMTWDVRSVPAARNVAYTSQDLGFHMDLLYMKQPPHLQFLHCIRSSAQGGASLFSDTYRVVQALYTSKPNYFQILSEYEIPYHYDHADAEPRGHYYHHSHPVISLEPLRFVHPDGPSTAALSPSILHLRSTAKSNKAPWTIEQLTANLPSYIKSVAWSPPFQAPMSTESFTRVHPEPRSALEQGFVQWRRAARAFDRELHRKEAVYERLMKPGECVLFDNTRIVHARKAFVPGDEGSERWLRGAYVDRDPYESRLKVLMKKEMEEKGGMDELGAPHWMPDAA